MESECIQYAEGKIFMLSYTGPIDGHPGEHNPLSLANDSAYGLVRTHILTATAIPTYRSTSRTSSHQIPPLSAHAHPGRRESCAPGCCTSGPCGCCRGCLPHSSKYLIYRLDQSQSDTQAPIPPTHRLLSGLLTALTCRSALAIMGYYWITTELVSSKKT